MSGGSGRRRVVPHMMRSGECIGFRVTEATLNTKKSHSPICPELPMVVHGPKTRRTKGTPAVARCTRASKRTRPKSLILAVPPSPNSTLLGFWGGK